MCCCWFYLLLVLRFKLKVEKWCRLVWYIVYVYMKIKGGKMYMML